MSLSVVAELFTSNIRETSVIAMSPGGVHVFEMNAEVSVRNGILIMKVNGSYFSSDMFLLTQLKGDCI